MVGRCNVCGYPKNFGKYNEDSRTALAIDNSVCACYYVSVCHICDRVMHKDHPVAHREDGFWFCSDECVEEYRIDKELDK